MSSSAIPKPTHRSIPSFQSPKIHRNPNFTTNFTTTKSIQNTISENPKYSHHHDRQPLLPPRPKDFQDHLKAPLQTNTNFAETPTNKKSHHHQIKSIKTSEPTVAENHQHPNTQPQTSAADPRSCQAHNTLHAAVTPPYHLIRGWCCHLNLTPPLQSDTTSTPIEDISLQYSSVPLVLLLASSWFLSGCFTVRCCLFRPNKFITCFYFSSQKKKKGRGKSSEAVLCNRPIPVFGFCSAPQPIDQDFFLLNCPHRAESALQLLAAIKFQSLCFVALSLSWKWLPLIENLRSSWE